MGLVESFKILLIPSLYSSSWPLDRLVETDGQLNTGWDGIREQIQERLEASFSPSVTQRPWVLARYSEEIQASPYNMECMCMNQVRLPLWWTWRKQKADERPTWNVGNVDVWSYSCIVLDSVDLIYVYLVVPAARRLYSYVERLSANNIYIYVQRRWGFCIMYCNKHCARNIATK